jgi:hypothetical protein
MENYLGLIFLVLIYLLGFWAIQKGRKGDALFIRQLGVFDAIKEAIGRAVEMGRPVLFSTGHAGGGLTSANAGAHMAGISMLGYVATECAKLGAKIIFVPGFAEMIPLGENIIHDAYREQGAEELITPDMVRYVSDNPHAFNIGCIAVMRQENTAANILIGAYWSSDALVIAGAGALTGAIQIGGGTSIGPIANFIATCSYVVMGEEVPASGAFASQDIPMLNNIVSGDYVKYIVIGLAILGSVLISLGVDISWFTA